MRKLISVGLMAMLLAVMVPAFASTAAAQKRYFGNERRYSSGYKKPSVYRRHRNLINIAIGTGAGAIVGGLIGGKRGAGIGVDCRCRRFGTLHIQTQAQKASLSNSVLSEIMIADQARIKKAASHRRDAAFFSLTTA